MYHLRGVYIIGCFRHSISMLSNISEIRGYRSSNMFLYATAMLKFSIAPLLTREFWLSENSDFLKLFCFTWDVNRNIGQSFSCFLLLLAENMPRRLKCFFPIFWNIYFRKYNRYDDIIETRV